jgi:capsular polysaccharide biosynthesis protein
MPRIRRVARKMLLRLKGSRMFDWFVEIARRSLPRAVRTGPPKGTFSAYRLLQRQEVPGEALLHRQEFAPIPPDAMRIRSGLNQHRHQPWPIFWTHHVNARLVGSTLVLFDDQKHACLEAMYVEHHPSDPAFRSILVPPPDTLAGEWTSIISRWTRHPNYYHWFMDAMPRLALLDRLPPETRILTAGNMEPFQVETFGLLDLEDRFFPTSASHLLVESYFFSSPTAMTGCTNPYAVKFLRDRILSLVDTSADGPEKIYILRQAKARGVVNEDEVVEFLSEHGWTAVSPENLSLVQQIQMFASARAICGVHGAGLTNMVWCSPECKVIEMMADNRLNGCFESISSCVGHQHHYLIFPGDKESRIRVSLEALASVLSA